MEHFQGHEFEREAHDPNAQKRHHRTNEFYHRASEAMGLPWENGKSVSQAILRNIIRRISQEEARHLISELPLGLKEECVAFNKEPLKSISAEKIMHDIENAAGIQGVDPARVARDFWVFLTGWLNEYEDERKGETYNVLNQLPRDIKSLLTGVSQ